MRQVNNFDRNTNLYLENQIRSYPELETKIKLAESLENEKSASYYILLKENIEKTLDKLPEELKRIINIYFWGEYRYIKDWDTIGEEEFHNKRRGYTARTQIIETFAEVRGILIK